MHSSSEYGDALHLDQLCLDVSRPYIHSCKGIHSCHANWTWAYQSLAPQQVSYVSYQRTMTALLPVSCLNPFRCCKLVACCAVCRRDDLFTSMLPKYHDILRHQADLDILVFSGDVDGIVPVIGTRRWLASLELPIVKEWRPWYSHTGKLPLTLLAFIHLPRNVVQDHTLVNSSYTRSLWQANSETVALQLVLHDLCM